MPAGGGAAIDAKTVQGRHGEIKVEKFSERETVEGFGFRCKLGGHRRDSVRLMGGQFSAQLANISGISCRYFLRPSFLENGFRFGG